MVTKFEIQITLNEVTKSHTIIILTTTKNRHQNLKARIGVCH